MNAKTQLFDFITTDRSPDFRTDHGILYNADCLDILRLMPDESVDTIFADPPFNLNKEYKGGINDDLSDDVYIAWCRTWIIECIRVLSDGGSLFIYNLPKWNIPIANILMNKKLIFRNWIAIEMKSRPPIKGRLYPSHYSLLYFSKGEPKYFNNPRRKIETCRHCGKEIKDYGGYRSKMKDDMVNLGDIWSDFSPVRHKKYKTRDANELPIGLMERIISMSTPMDGILLDPFGGSGTSFVACESLHINWIGSEIGDCSTIKERLNKYAK